MRVKVHSRTAGELDWECHRLELHRLPAVDEFIAMRPDGGTDARWHQVQVVVHVPFGSECEAEVYCTECGPNQPRRIAYGSTMPKPESIQEQGGQDGIQRKLLSEDEAAEAAGVDRKTIRRLIEAGRLAAADYGTGKKKLYRINRDDLPTVQQEVPDTIKVKPHRQFVNASAAYLPWNQAKATAKPASNQPSSKQKNK